MLLRSPITLTYTQISNTLYTHNIIRRLVCGFCALLASVASIYLQAGHPALTVVSLGRTTCPALAYATLGYSLGNGDNAVNARGYVVDLLSLRLRSVERHDGLLQDAKGHIVVGRMGRGPKSVEDRTGRNVGT